jgi:uncharacterized protein
MQEQIERDLKAALLAGDKHKVEVLKGVKTALQYEAVNSKSTDRTLDNETIQKVIAKESKKRQDTADIYQKAGEQERANTELTEKKIIDEYLPKQLSETEIAKTVEEELEKLENPQPSDMGRLIGAVKGRLQAQADGATIAKLVKEKLQK